MHLNHLSFKAKKGLHSWFIGGTLEKITLVLWVYFELEDKCKRMLAAFCLLCTVLLLPQASLFLHVTCYLFLFSFSWYPCCKLWTSPSVGHRKGWHHEATYPNYNASNQPNPNGLPHLGSIMWVLLCWFLFQDIFISWHFWENFCCWRHGLQALFPVMLWICFLQLSI